MCFGCGRVSFGVAGVELVVFCCFLLFFGFVWFFSGFFVLGFVFMVFVLTKKVINS